MLEDRGNEYAHLTPEMAEELADKAVSFASYLRSLARTARLHNAAGDSDPDMDEATRADMQQWTGCVAGALTRAEFEDALAAAGLAEIEVNETHRVHEHATSAIVRAWKPRA